jgi:hypothetical protein
MGWAAARPRVSSLAKTRRPRHYRKFQKVSGLEISLIMPGDMGKGIREIPFAAEIAAILYKQSCYSIINCFQGAGHERLRNCRINPIIAIW